MRRLGKSLNKRIKRIRRHIERALYPPMKPTVVVIGAQKGGTTALYKYLSSHPGVTPSLVKEIDFFNYDINFDRKEEFYHSHFSRQTPANNTKITFDISPGYLYPDSKTAQRIFEYNPNLKLIALLRNPATRAFSAWQMYKKFYSEDRDWFFKWLGSRDYRDPYKRFTRRDASFGRDFLHDLNRELEIASQGKEIEMPILVRGLYASQLEEFYKFFPKEQILIIESADLKKNTRKWLSEIEIFSGLPAYDWPETLIRPHFEGSYQGQITEKEKALLDDYYRGPNENLFQLLGCRYDWV